MWRLIIVLLLLIASVWLGVLIVKHPGYLLVVYNPWTIQMPLWFVLISLVIFLLLFYFLISSIDHIQYMWHRLNNWVKLRREKQSYRKTYQGLTALIEGKSKQAERLLISGMNHSADPLINYLGAAKASHNQGAYDRRDRYIQSAYKIAPGNDVAIGLTQATLEIKEKQFEKAQATLKHLFDIDQYNPKVLKLLEKVYIHLADWQNLLKLLPLMKRAKLLNPKEFELFQKNIYAELLSSVKPNHLTQSRAVWSTFPRQFRRNPELVYDYVKQIYSFPEAKDEIESLILSLLKHHFHPGLVKIYSTLSFSNLNHQLVIGGNWIKSYGSQPEILLFLGKICMRLELWGKARDYFERAIDQAHLCEAYLEYGKLLETLDEPLDALEKYKEGIEITCNNLK